MPLRVLTYHRIADPTDTPDLDPTLVSATPEAFRRQMLHLRKRYRPVSLDEVVETFSARGSLPERSVHVTVDDAYRDFAEFAWPILREFEIPVTVFVPTAYPDDPTRTLWWDRLHQATRKGTTDETWKRAMSAAKETLEDVRWPELSDYRAVRGMLRDLHHDDMERFIESTCREVGLDDIDASAVLTWDELRELAREGVKFGAHTRHHAALTGLEEIRVRSEIRGSLEDLEREIGPGLRPIAYPYGLYNSAVSRIAREEGCTLGFTCDDGLNDPSEADPFRLCRTNITPRTSPPVFALRMLPWFAEIDRWRHRNERGSFST